MFFCGEQRMSLDDKGRIRVPMKFRLAFAKEDQGEFVIYAGTNGSLFVESEKSFKLRYCELMQDTQLGDTVKQEAFRKLCSTVQVPEEDGQGRFVLQPKLKAMAGIKKKVVFLGVGDRLEIWSEEIYDSKYSAENIDMDMVVKTLEL